MSDASKIDGATIDRTAWHVCMHNLDLIFEDKESALAAHNTLVGALVYKGYSYKNEFDLAECVEDAVVIVKKCTLWNVPESTEEEKSDD